MVAMERDVARELRAEAAPTGDTARPNETPEAAITLPEGLIPVLPLRDAVLFPGVVIPLTVGRERSLAAAQYAVRTKSQIAVLLQKLADVNDPKAADMHDIGTVADVVRYVTG